MLFDVNVTKVVDEYWSSQEYVPSLDTMLSLYNPLTAVGRLIGQALSADGAR